MLQVQTVWGWQIALYLFLGGLGAGTFIASAYVFLSSRKKTGTAVPEPAGTDRPGDGHEMSVRLDMVLFITTWIAVACLCVGLLLLLSDLIQPWRGLMLWQSFSNTNSWMTIGAWLLLVTVVIFIASAICMTSHVIPAFKGKKGAPRKLEKVLLILGAVLGICVAAYTGILLMSAQGIPFWNTGLLPCLFVVSALGTGIALVEITIACAKPRGIQGSDPLQHTTRSLKIIGLVLVVFEATLLFSYVYSMLGVTGDDPALQAARQSAGMLVDGDLSVLFWGVVVCALVVSSVATLSSFFLEAKAGRAVMVVSAICVLAGGCALRFVVLFAGVQTDPIITAISKLVS
jgi:formate-dependent nitrite reductase membrane component NrfD